ncbi:DsbA family protein [Bosea sp. F3-2]|uniref:DsbA family protein n=1 Tax=Bosea sp. F3-2 TaxID=2599640 RepID=UPI0011EC27CA|nr:DsbA family protein [Bosea sp. F3-2]QEL23246.1 DsbA family protein [Bosea sp. F3-2]
MTNRRQLLTGAAGIAAAALAGLNAARAQTKLPDAGPLGDVWLGSPDAKVSIVEYASMTCSHCAHFHQTTWPELKKKYIDTGKARFTLREFPLDPLATAGFMLARCNGNDKFYPMTDLLFAQQRNWAFTEKPVDALATLVKQAGFTQESFEACLKRQDIYDAVTVVKDGGAKAGVDSTPTFFINGQKRSGALSIAEFDKILEPLLGN